MIELSENGGVEKRHSRLGIASVVIGISVPVLLSLLIIILILLGSTGYSATGAIGGGFGIFALLAPMFHLVGIVIGVTGWISKQTKNFYAVIGAILNLVLGIAGIVLIGTVVGFLVWVISKVPVH